MTSSAVVARFPGVEPVNEVGARLRARRKSLGLTGVALAKLAQVSRTHLSDVENGHELATAEWARRVEKAMDDYARETGQESIAPVLAAPATPSTVRVEVQGVYGAKALVFEAPVEDVAVLEAMVDRIMRRLAGEQVDAPASDTPGD